MVDHAANPAFRKALNRLLKEFGAATSSSIMNNGVAARLESPQFLKNLIGLGESVKNRHLVRKLVKDYPVVKF